MNRKIRAIVIIAISLILPCFLIPHNSGDMSIYYMDLINSEFGISLSPSNCSLQYGHSLLSRDSIYSVCFNLDPSYSQVLHYASSKWAKDARNWNTKYLLPYIGIVDGLDAMLIASQDPNSYSIIDIREDNSYSVSFSILSLSMDNNQLFYFHIST